MLFRTLPLMLILLAALSSARSVYAEEDFDSAVKADLVADVSAVAPGSVFHVGVKFVMREGWHIYWINPGDSGLPTVMTLKPDSNFSAGDVLWPTPIRFTQPGGIRGYGYEKETLLYAPVTVSKSAVSGSTIRLPISVKWLGCAHVCVPGRAEFELALEVKDRSVAVNQGLFETYEKHLPRTVADGVRVVDSQVRNLANAPPGESRFELTLESAQDLGVVQALVGHDRSLASEEPTVEKEGLRVRITFQTKVNPGKKGSESAFPVLIVGSKLKERGIPALQHTITPSQTQPS